MSHSPLSKEPEKLGKKLLGEKDVEELLKKLDRLMQEESRTTATLTLEIIYDFTENTRVFMESKSWSFTFLSKCAKRLLADEKKSTNYVRDLVGLFESLVDLCVSDCISQLYCKRRKTTI